MLLLIHLTLEDAIKLRFEIKLSFDPHCSKSSAKVNESQYGSLPRTGDLGFPNGANNEISSFLNLCSLFYFFQGRILIQKNRIESSQIEYFSFPEHNLLKSQNLRTKRCEVVFLLSPNRW